MSLIQQALERTNRAHETRGTTPAETPKPYERDLLGASLEQELIRVQQAYSKRRNFYWKMTIVALTVFFVAGLFYAGFQGKHVRRGASALKAAPSAVSSASNRIYGGNSYHLTGITDLSGHAIAVINGRLVGVGDSLDARTVVRSIGNGVVLLEVQGKEFKLTL